MTFEKALKALDQVCSMFEAKKLPTVLTAEELLDKAFGRASKVTGRTRKEKTMKKITKLILLFLAVSVLTIYLMRDQEDHVLTKIVRTKRINTKKKKIKYKINKKTKTKSKN